MVAMNAMLTLMRAEVGGGKHGPLSHDIVVINFSFTYTHVSTLYTFCFARLGRLSDKILAVVGLRQLVHVQ